MPEQGQFWRIRIERRAEKVLNRLPKDLVQRILNAIHGLVDNPYPRGVKKLAGYDNLFRIRVGDWRISYAIQNDELLILVLEIAPRGGAYRNL